MAASSHAYAAWSAFPEFGRPHASRNVTPFYRASLTFQGVLQMAASSHAAWNASQKASAGMADFRFIPPGTVGAGERMHLLWDLLVASGRISVTDYVRLTSAAAAHVFNVHPRKGVLAPGSDADVIVLDPRRRHRLGVRAARDALACDTSVYEGWEGSGLVVATVAGGRVVFENGRLQNLERGRGRFVPLPPNGPLFKVRLRV